MTGELFEELREDFTVARETGKAWVISCRHCGAQYALVKPASPADVKMGTVVSLMNHALKHGGGRRKDR